MYKYFFLEKEFKLEGAAPLKDNEWLVKVRDDNMGFLVQLTQKKELPKAFREWTRKWDYDNNETV
jgi:hypothetical protein